MKKYLILASLPLLFLCCAPEEPSPDPHYPLATITMEAGGVIQVELYPDIAPNTVNNFIDLAESGFYDNQVFYCIMPDVIQGGCPLGTGKGGPGYTIRGEFASNGFENDLSIEAGTVFMARLPDDFDSAGSQFSIVVDSRKDLDGHYAGFGRVISGLDVVIRISEAEKDENGLPLEPQRIKSVTINAFGRRYPPPEKIGGN